MCGLHLERPYPFPDLLLLVDLTALRVRAGTSGRVTALLPGTAVWIPYAAFPQRYVLRLFEIVDFIRG